MTAKDFNKKKTDLYKKYGLSKTDKRYEVQIKTPFGILYIKSEYTPRIKIASIYSRLEGNAKEFKEVTGYDIDICNGKCNFYSYNAEYILDTLEEYIDNMQYLKLTV